MKTNHESAFKCTNCGGRLKRPTFDMLKCCFCDEEFKIDGKDIDLLNQANQLRLSYKFSEALDVYLEILKEDSDFVEANWGALLSEYGVEYVEDRGNKIPVLHRPVLDYKITDDKFARSILNNTIGEAHHEYFEKISKLEDLRQEIEAACLNLPKYDIFISCKITNPESEHEEKTPDYEWGQLIYKKLSQRGLNVFFSPVSLPATNGPYEPIIYSALQSAKYLILLSSKVEYLESTWIKNEWGRFLDIKKRSNEPRFFKLVIDSSVAKSVPPTLKKESSYIEFDNKLQWLSNLEKAVLEKFPEYAQVKYGILAGGFMGINLKYLEKPKNKQYQSRMFIQKGTEQYIVPHNPFKVDFQFLEQAYYVEDNVETCFHKVSIYLRNEKFKEAQLELNEYLSFINYSKERDYKILILELLLSSKSKSLDDFFENKIEHYNDMSHIKIIIGKLTVDSVIDFLKPLSQYITQSIMMSKKNNAILYLESIAQINDDVVKDLHIAVVRSLPYLISDSSSLIEFANISLPYIASQDINQYVMLASDLATILCKNSKWVEAQQVAENVLISDPQNSKCKLILLMVQNKSNNHEQLLSTIENNNNFHEIEALFPQLYKTGVTNLVNIIKKRVIELIKLNQYTKACSWLEILAITDFSTREIFFQGIIDICINKPDSHLIFLIAIKTVPEDKLDYIIQSTIQFVSVLMNNNYFSIAKQICKEIIDYDTSNMTILNYYLNAEIESHSLDNIHMLHDMTIVERMLVNCSNTFDQEQLLLKIINACISYISKNFVEDNNNVFNVFDKILSYYPDTSDKHPMKNKIKTFAQKCLEKKLYDKALWYFTTLIRLDPKSHEAYWGILLSMNKCTTDEELIKIPYQINQFKEYSLALMHAQGNTEYENRYSSVYSKQLSNKKNSMKKRIKLPLYLFILTLIIFIIIMII